MVDLQQKQDGFYEGSATDGATNTWLFQFQFLGTYWQLNITCTAGPLVGGFNTFSTSTRRDIPLDARNLVWGVEDFDPEIYWDWESELKFYPVPPEIYPQQIA